MTGYDPRLILDDSFLTELETLESMAEGISPGIQTNNARIDRIGVALRWAGWMLIAAPLVGGVSYGIARAWS